MKKLIFSYIFLASLNVFASSYDADTEGNETEFLLNRPLVHQRILDAIESSDEDDSYDIAGDESYESHYVPSLGYQIIPDSFDSCEIYVRSKLDHITDVFIKEILYHNEKYDLKWRLTTIREGEDFFKSRRKMSDATFWFYFYLFLDSPTTVFFYDITSPRVSIYLEDKIKYDLESRLKLVSLDSQFRLTIF